MQISARGILATITASAGQNGHFSKVGTVTCLSDHLYITTSFVSRPYLFLPSVFPCIRHLYNDPLSNATNDRVLWVKILHITTCILEGKLNKTRLFHLGIKKQKKSRTISISGTFHKTTQVMWDQFYSIVFKLEQSLGIDTNYRFIFCIEIYSKRFITYHYFILF
jgi:hypothetical protein